MPVIPNLVERTYVLRLNRGPGPMLDLLGGMGLEAAMVGLDLGLFEALDGDPATPERLAERLDADEAGLATLLAYLERTGYLAGQGERYAVSGMAERWLLESAETSYARYFRFWRELLYPFWREHAADAIRAGEPPVSVYEWLDDRPGKWPVAQAAFELTADLIADDVAATLDPPDGGSLLDVGGGHALYSVAACDRYPSVSATILDDSTVEHVAAENVAAAGFEDRIDFEDGDYETDSLGTGYDVVLLFNVVHGNDRETNRALFRKAGEAVAPGGQVAVLDQFADESRASIANTGTRFLDLTYLVSLGGRTYHTETVEGWLADAGLRRTGRREFQDRNTTLLVAERA